MGLGGRGFATSFPLFAPDVGGDTALANPACGGAEKSLAMCPYTAAGEGGSDAPGAQLACLHSTGGWVVQGKEQRVGGLGGVWVRLGGAAGEGRLGGG